MVVRQVFHRLLYLVVLFLIRYSLGGRGYMCKAVYSTVLRAAYIVLTCLRLCGYMLSLM